MSLQSSVDIASALPARRSAWIPWVFAGSLAVVVAVNVALAYFALHSAPGTVSERPFEDGLAYDSVLERAAAQDALGWTSAISTPSVAGAGVIRVRLADRSNAPVTGAAAELGLARPVGPREAFTAKLRESEPGIYAAAVTLGPGQWQLSLVARRGGDSFAAVERIAVK